MDQNRMFAKRSSTFAALALALLVSWSGGALAQDATQINAECARAYELAQLQRNSRSPRCNDAQLSRVGTKYLLADVSLGVGVASFAHGAYFYFSGAGSQPQGAVSPSRLTLLAAPGSVGVAYRSTP